MRKQMNMSIPLIGRLALFGTVLLTMAAVHGAALKSTETAVEAGKMFPLEGTGFHAGQTVRLVLLGALTEYTLREVTVDGEGAFVFAVDVPADVGFFVDAWRRKLPGMEMLKKLREGQAGVSHPDGGFAHFPGAADDNGRRRRGFQVPEPALVGEKDDILRPRFGGLGNAPDEQVRVSFEGPAQPVRDLRQTQRGWGCGIHLLAWLYVRITLSVRSIFRLSKKRIRDRSRMMVNFSFFPIRLTTSRVSR